MTSVLIAADEIAPTTLEPCDGFRSDDTAFPVCATCGWLDHEHEARQ